MKSLITVASNALPLLPLQMNKQTLCSLHLLDTKNKGDKKQDGSQDELNGGPVHDHTGQQRTQVLRH